MSARPHPFRVLATAALLGTAVGIPVLLAIQVSGCAQHSDVQAGDLETRLTHDGEGKAGLFFALDGGSVLYTNGVQVMTGSTQFRRVERVSVDGGEPTIIKADSSAFQTVGWFPDGKSFLLSAGQEDHLERIDLEGNLIETYPLENMVRVFGVEPDGVSFLVRMFNGSTYDLGVKSAEGVVTPILETDEWEVEVCNGPGRDEVTVSTFALPSDDTNRFQVFSRTTDELRDLPLSQSRVSGPCWSPDGGLLAYGAEGEAGMDLWLYDPSTDQETRLTSGAEDEVSPRWSPDGETLAFIKKTTFSNIWIADSETHEARQLTHGDVVDFEAWPSPDGSNVVFVRETREGGVSRLTLWLVTVGNGETREIPLHGYKLSHVGLRPSWSPDGAEVAISAVDDEGQVDIYRVGLDGAPPMQVTVGSGMEAFPSWSPDGRTILFTRIENGQSQVWSIPANGGITRQLSSRDGLNGWAVWAKDSDQFAYLSVPEGQGSQTWVTSLSRPKEQTLIAESGKIVVPVAWSDDTGEIILWREADEVVHLCAIKPDGSGERAIALQDKETNEGSAFRFKPGEEGYRNLCYDGDRYTFSRSRSVGDIYLLRVSDFVRRQQGSNPGAE